MLKHTFYEKIALLKTSVFVRISSLTFYYECIFPLKTEKPGMIQCPLKVILWLSMFTPEDTTYSNFKSE